jgi:putative PIN family toxin of toxin-antitoxin system
MPGDIARAKPRAVLDSNVIISGLAFARGNPRQALDMLREGEIEVVISPFILFEVAASLREDFGWDQADIESELTLLRSRCVVTDPPPDASVSQLSAADNRILDCAVRGRVHYLVTGDHGIQRIGGFHEVRIVSPSQFLDICRQLRTNIP